MIVIGDAPLGRGCALACAPCSSAGPAAASAAPVRRTLRRSISLSSAVGWLTISPSMAHRSHALRSLKIEAWLWPPVKETGPRRCPRAIISGSQRRMELPAVTKAARSLKGSQSMSRRYATLRQRLSGSRFSCSRPPPAAASTRPLIAVLAARYAVPPSYSGRAFCRSRRADELRDQLCRYASSSRALCCRPPQGRQAHGPAGYAGHQGRAVINLNTARALPPRCAASWIRLDKVVGRDFPVVRGVNRRRGDILPTAEPR